MSERLQQISQSPNKPPRPDIDHQQYYTNIYTHIAVGGKEACPFQRRPQLTTRIIRVRNGGCDLVGIYLSKPSQTLHSAINIPAAREQQADRRQVLLNFSAVVLALCYGGLILMAHKHHVPTHTRGTPK